MNFKIIFLIFITCLAFFILTNNDYKLFVIQSGSMEPSFQIGDLIIVKSQNNYQINDVITYKNNDKIVTHRITKISNNIFQTKGDANRIDDFSHINSNEIIGKVIQVIPKVGLLINFAQSKIGFIFFFLTPLIWLKN